MSTAGEGEKKEKKEKIEGKKGGGKLGVGKEKENYMVEEKRDKKLRRSLVILAGGFYSILRI